MSFLDKLLKIVSYYNDEENPLHETDFIMEWDGLSDEEKENYVKSFIAGLAIVLSVSVYAVVVEHLLDYIENYKDVLRKAGEDAAKKTLVSEVKRLAGVDDRPDEAKRILNELDEVLNSDDVDLVDEFTDRENMREPFKNYFNTLFSDEEQKKIIIDANNAKTDISRDLFKRQVSGWIKGRMLAKKIYNNHIIN